METVMNVFEEHRWHAPSALSTEQVGYFRLILASHGANGSSGACMICGVLRCQDWCTAYDQLAAAGELMADPVTWLDSDRSSPEDQR